MRLLACSFAALLVIAGQMPPQPDFSGRWVLVAPEAAPPDVPRILTVQQHVRRTDIHGKPIPPGFDLLIVESDDLRSGIEAGIYSFGRSGTVSGTGARTTQDVTWYDQKLVIASASWMEHESGKREQVREHTEVWSLDEHGQLTIAVSDKKDQDDARTRTVKYRKDVPARLAGN